MVPGARRLYMLITILIVIRVIACRVLGKAWRDLGYQLCVVGWGVGFIRRGPDCCGLARDSDQ